jgi:hypothetical protein
MDTMQDEQCPTAVTCRTVVAARVG